MDDLEKATLLIRVAKQVGNGGDGRALLTWAEELLSGAGAASAKAKARTKTEVSFPVSVFAHHKGKKYDALLLQDCKIQLDGKVYRSPSAAAAAIAGYRYPVNGWRFWRYRNEKGEERPIDDLRE